MKLQSFSLIAAAGLALAACGNMAGPTEDVDPVTRAVSGNTLTHGDVVIHANADGTLGGTSPDGELRGTWAVRDGQWCDTIVEPEDWAASTCMDVELGDGELTFINEDGTPGNTWEIS